MLILFPFPNFASLIPYHSFVLHNMCYPLRKIQSHHQTDICDLIMFPLQSTLCIGRDCFDVLTWQTHRNHNACFSIKVKALLI